MTDVGYLAAFAGGVVSFASPCVLPIVPAYLSIITGLDVAELQHGTRRHLFTIARDTALFVAGFSAVFILLGVSATTIGGAVFRNQARLTRVSGLAVLTMALFLAGSLVLRSPWLYQEKRFHPNLSRFGPFAAPVAGAAFGFGWTPCIGPVLGSVLAVAAAQHNARHLLARPGHTVPRHRPGVRTCRRRLRLRQTPLHRHHRHLLGVARGLRSAAHPQPPHLAHQPTPDPAAPRRARTPRFPRMKGPPVVQS